MRILETCIVRGASGQANKFQIIPIHDGATHKFESFTVHAVLYGSGDDLTTDNVINALEQHLEGKIGNLYRVDRLTGPGARQVADVVKASTLENISTTQKYLQMIQDGVELNFTYIPNN